MLFPVRMGSMVFALAIASPAMAQQTPIVPFPASHIAKADRAAGYRKACGDYFRCYNGIPLHCASNTRPYQDVAHHRCLCMTDACPQ